MENMPKTKNKILSADFSLSHLGGGGGGAGNPNSMVQTIKFRFVGVLTYIMTCYVSLIVQIVNRKR